MSDTYDYIDNDEDEYDGLTKEQYEEYQLLEEMRAQHGSPKRDRLIDGIDLEFNIITSDIDNPYAFWGKFFNKSIYHPSSMEYDTKTLPIEQMTIQSILDLNIRAIGYYLTFADDIKELYVDFIDQEWVKDEYDKSAECISCSRENWSEKCDKLFMRYQLSKLNANKYLVPTDDQIIAIYENMTDQEIELVRNSYREYDGIKLLVMLLMIRIEQLKDSIAFYILAANEYYAIERKMAFKLMLLFLNDPLFFIQNTIKYKGHHLIEDFIEYFPRMFVPEYFFTQYRTELNIKLKAGQLFVYPPNGDPYGIEYEYEYDTTDKLKQILAQQPTEPAHFMPKTEESLKNWQKSFPTLQEGVINFPNFGDYWGKDLLSKLTEDEKVVYDKYIYPHLQENIIRNYHVNSSTGLAYLKQESNDKSETLRVIANDEYVCFLKDSGSWVQVYYPQGDNDVSGYIHTSQLEQR